MHPDNLTVFSNYYLNFDFFLLVSREEKERFVHTKKLVIDFILIITVQEGETDTKLLVNSIVRVTYSICSNLVLATCWQY